MKALLHTQVINTLMNFHPFVVGSSTFDSIQSNTVSLSRFSWTTRRFNSSSIVTIGRPVVGVVGTMSPPLVNSSFWNVYNSIIVKIFITCVMPHSGQRQYSKQIGIYLYLLSNFFIRVLQSVKIISLILSRVNRKLGRKWEISEENHQTTRKQNLTCLTWPKLGSNPQAWADERFRTSLLTSLTTRPRGPPHKQAEMSSFGPLLGNWTSKHQERNQNLKFCHRTRELEPAFVKHYAPTICLPKFQKFLWTLLKSR